MIRGHRFFKWRNIGYSLESLVLSRFIFQDPWKKSALETLHACSLFHPPSLFLSFFYFSLLVSTYRPRRREYFTAGINQRNSGKQLIIPLLTISLLCAFYPHLFSFRSTAKSVHPRFYRVSLIWLLFLISLTLSPTVCARGEINVISFT